MESSNGIHSMFVYSGDAHRGPILTVATGGSVCTGRALSNGKRHGSREHSRQKSLEESHLILSFLDGV
jgi:hypothetical protein